MPLALKDIIFGQENDKTALRQYSAAKQFVYKSSVDDVGHLFQLVNEVRMAQIIASDVSPPQDMNFACSVVACQLVGSRCVIADSQLLKKVEYVYDLRKAAGSIDDLLFGKSLTMKDVNPGEILTGYV